MEAYCLKCKGPHEIKDPKEITLKNGRAATQGKCGACGSKVFRIGKATQSFIGTMRKEVK